MKLTDEILNKYIDDELDSETLKEVRIILNESEADRQRLRILLKVHNQLKKIEEYKPGNDFTLRVMERISAKLKPKKSDKYFIFSISSFFILLSLGVIGIVFALLIQSPSESSSSQQVFSYLISSLESFSLFFRTIFSGSGLSIFGSIISFGILISAYFFFDTHKHLKDLQKSSRSS